MNVIERIDFTRQFLLDQLGHRYGGRLGHPYFLDVETWDNLVGLTRKNILGFNVGEVVDSHLSSRQGVLYPFIADNENEFVILTCPDVFALYPREEDFDDFLQLWAIKLRTVMQLYDQWETQEERVDGVVRFLLENGLTQEQIDFPPY